MRGDHFYLFVEKTSLNIMGGVDFFARYFEEPLSFDVSQDFKSSILHTRILLSVGVDATVFLDNHFLLVDGSKWQLTIRKESG